MRAIKRESKKEENGWEYQENSRC